MSEVAEATYRAIGRFIFDKAHQQISRSER
jgi:hypothetical protein